MMLPKYVLKLKDIDMRCPHVDLHVLKETKHYGPVARTYRVGRSRSGTNRSGLVPRNEPDMASYSARGPGRAGRSETESVGRRRRPTDFPKKGSRRPVGPSQGQGVFLIRYTPRWNIWRCVAGGENLGQNPSRGGPLSKRFQNAKKRAKVLQP